MEEPLDELQGRGREPGVELQGDQLPPRGLVQQLQPGPVGLEDGAAAAGERGTRPVAERRAQEGQPGRGVVDVAALGDLRHEQPDVGLVALEPQPPAPVEPRDPAGGRPLPVRLQRVAELREVDAHGGRGGRRWLPAVQVLEEDVVVQAAVTGGEEERQQPRELRRERHVDPVAGQRQVTQDPDEDRRHDSRLVRGTLHGRESEMSAPGGPDSLAA